jgi:transcriptional regulator with XRE-family HTH domain
MQAVSDQLKDFMRARGMTQIHLAQQAKVSQSTVSRAISRRSERHGEARRRLFIYAGIDDSEADSSTAAGTKLIIQAFLRIWDGSDAHALAVARIIEALRDLRPASR